MSTASINATTPEAMRDTAGMNEALTDQTRIDTTAQAAVATPARRSFPRRGKRIGALAALTTLLATSLVLAGTGTASAGYTAGGGQTVDSGVRCDYASRQLVVRAEATQMYNYPAYANGQWVRYQVFTRNVTYSTGPWVLSASWSPWQWVNASSQVGEMRILTEQHLGNTTLYGQRGHKYQVAVQYDHYMGGSSVGTDYTPTYTQTYGYLYQNPTSCVF